MINIAKSYTEKDFLETFQAIVDDIPPDVIEDQDDLASAVFEGLKVNEPKAFKYFKDNSSKLKAVIHTVLSDYVKKYHKKNFSNSGDYMEYFRDKLQEWGVSSPSELSDSQKPKFFKEVKAGK